MLVFFAHTQKVNALKRRVDEVDIPAAKRADIKAKIAQLQVIIAIISFVGIVVNRILK